MIKESSFLLFITWLCSDASLTIGPSPAQDQTVSTLELELELGTGMIALTDAV